MRRATTTGATLGLVLLGAGPANADPTEPHELLNPLVWANHCEYCHSYNNDPAVGTDPYYAPWFTWRGSMMANAARDPVFWAAVAIASQDAPEPSETQACIRCHAPRAFLEGRGDAIAQDELQLEDLAGVECELCHRMVDDGALGNGQYSIDDVLVGMNVPRRGPWSYEGGDIPAPPHEVLADAYIGSSELCGTCHDVTTARERVDAEGNPLGTGFNEQRTYREWAGSTFARAGDGFRSCQACHMPAVADMPGCRDYVTEHAHPTGGRRHDLLGANRFVIELLAEDASLVESLAFDHSLTQLDEFVRTSATLDVQGPPSVDLGSGLEGLRVTVTNETGHKLPTGYSEGRVMWLEVVARLGEDVLWSSGEWDPAAQAFARDPQVRTYEAIARQHATGTRFHLLLNDEWAVDTRIPPRGLLPDPETDPVTDRYALQDDGTWPSFDAHEYAFPGLAALADADGGELRVTVRLLYLVNTAEYVQVLEDDNVTNTAGTEVATRFADAGGAPPLVLAEQELLVPIVNEVDPPADSSGGEAGTTTDASGTTSSGGAASTGEGSTAGATDDGPGAADGGNDGCGCRSAPREHGRGLGLLPLLGLFALRSRRRVLALACTALLGCEGDRSASDDDVTGTDGTTTFSTGDSTDAAGSTTLGSGTTDDTGPEVPPTPEPWVWDLPPGFPEPYVPPDNPMSAAKVELGRHLFYDERLSVDGTYSCATCHRQELAFTDGLPRAEGVTGQLHPRGSMSLVNVAYASSLAWANPTLLDLETHALGPMFGTEPVELGLVDEADAVARISDDPTYDALFAAAFPGDDDPMTLDNIVKAIASFERTIISGRSPFDRFFFEGDETAISDAAKRGWEAFNFPGECTYCHFNFNYSDSTYFAALPERTLAFHNTGLYDVDGQGAYPAGNEGLFRFTGDPADMGKFKSPTLRNLAVTAPYMHDGSIATLEEVLEHYAQGGRADTPLVDFQMKTFDLKPGMVADFMAFFESLTDDAVLTDPALANPWEQ